MPNIVVILVDDLGYGDLDKVKREGLVHASVSGKLAIRESIMALAFLPPLQFPLQAFLSAPGLRDPIPLASFALR